MNCKFEEGKTYHVDGGSYRAKNFVTNKMETHAYAPFDLVCVFRTERMVMMARPCDVEKVGRRCFGRKVLNTEMQKIRLDEDGNEVVGRNTNAKNVVAERPEGTTGLPWGQQL